MNKRLREDVLLIAERYRVFLTAKRIAEDVFAFREAKQRQLRGKSRIPRFLRKHFLTPNPDTVRRILDELVRTGAADREWNDRGVAVYTLRRQ